MSSSRFVTPTRIALLSAFLFVGAVVRASAAAGLPGALGVIKLLGVPAAIAALFLGLELFYRSAPNFEPPAGMLALNRRILLWLIGLVDVVLATAIIFGVPFIATMTSTR